MSVLRGGPGLGLWPRGDLGLNSALPLGTKPSWICILTSSSLDSLSVSLSVLLLLLLSHLSRV